MKAMADNKLGDCVRQSMRRYFRDLNGEEAQGVYQMVLGEIEKPLFEAVMKQVAENQSEAARMLGISRGTLRKKLAQYGLTE